MKTCPKAYVIGDPIDHSLSPILHQTWLRQAGIRGEYKALRVKVKTLPQQLRLLFDNPAFVGANITLPHKQTVLAYADEITPIAKITGAANLLTKKNNKIIADNTDVEGFLEPLFKKTTAQQIMQSTALVFGSGGAARAVLVALLQQNIKQVFICNRSSGRAVALADDMSRQYPRSKIKVLAWENRNQPKTLPDLLINASSAGMTKFEPLDINLSFCHAATLVYDLVYCPKNTPLVQQAKSKGVEFIGGIEMLISQAKPCFRAFFSCEPPDDSMAQQEIIKIFEQNSRGKT